VHHAVEPHVDNTEPLEHEHPSLWHELQAADEEWAADHEGGPGVDEEVDTGEYLQGTYSTPPSPAAYLPPQPLPTPWYPTQPPTTSYRPRSNQFRPPQPHSRYYRDPPRAPRQRREYRPPCTPKTRRERYRPPRRTICDVYGERGPPPPPNRVDRHRYVPPTRHSRVQTPQRPRESTPRPRSPASPTQSPFPARNEHPTHPNRHRSTSPGSWRERPPHPHPPFRIQNRSDSPDWREARPDRPISFKTPSSPPVDLSTTPVPPLTPPKSIPDSRGISDLDSLVAQATSALRSITSIAQKLIRRVNAERRIAHKIQGRGFRVHEDVHGNVSRTTAPHVPFLEGANCNRVT
jgi:hypothetical protein